MKPAAVARPRWSHGRTASLILWAVLTHNTVHAQLWPDWDNGLAQQFVAPQNEARAAIGEPPLVWDDGLAQYAQWYASQRQGDCALQHSGGPYGENIFRGDSTGWGPADAVHYWVGEGQDYNYDTNSCAGGRQCGHYTQVIWSSTMRVGCAKVVCDGGSGVFMTCNYDPPGNYLGERPY